ncbi:Glycogen biosynthesis protein GlgD [bioreactor metagenome]|uniref:Glycogen biosynthesis protein GlgD n=1 Tax=bioreactor metagenome TaxID=1076179 RepID=A0A644TQP0_9ZZZZ|nr:glucose-1-phosphate adenylyltransferase subunit GlgD [Negativicutes bacterium]
MQNVMGIINLNESEELLREVTKHRPLAAVPFAGRYRVIDFILSSMVNSGIQNVGILVLSKYRALMDHLRSGKEWDLARKRDGLFILPPAETQPCGSGDIENFYRNLDYIKSSRQQYVLIAGSNTICNLNFKKAFQFHQAKQADITVLYKEQEIQQDDFKHCAIVDCDADGRIVDMAVNPSRQESRKVSMKMYLMAKTTLIDLITDCAARGGTDFLMDGIVKNVGKLAIYGYPYKGFMGRIHSVASYYHQNMELLKPDRWQELFFKSGPIYTKVKDEAPVKYKENAHIANAMIANGCVIEGTVENSILFRGVKVELGAYIKDSIIMQKCTIGANAKLENVICDKDVSISAEKWLKGEVNYPLVIEKGTVI